VTLYRGQALVRRAVPVAGPAGTRELVVGDLPREVVPQSLFAEGKRGVQVQAVRFRTRAVKEEPRESLRDLDRQIEAVQQQISRNGGLKGVAGKQSAYLDNLERFTAATAKTELSRGVLNAGTVERITQFIFRQRKATAEEALKLGEGMRKLQSQLSLLQRRRAELARGRSRSVREAVLFLSKKDRAAGQVTLSYVVSGASWSHAYNFRAAAKDKEVQVEFNAVINQMTGEDWKDVALTLSTASSALKAKAPSLLPFRVTLARRPSYQVRGSLLHPPVIGLGEQAASGQSRRLRSSHRLQGMPRTSGRAVPCPEDGLGAGGTSPGDELQSLELVIDPKSVGRIKPLRSARREQPGISYRLTGAVSLASRSDRQIVPIATVKLPASFRHVAAPLLTEHVYRQAELRNTHKHPLLAGPANIYFEGRFVGRSETNMVAPGQSFVVGCGADPGLRARRELVEKVERVQRGSRRIDFKYRLMLENYRDKPVRVRLLDRLPATQDASEVLVSLEEMKEKLSTDAEYQRRGWPLGILRWDLVVPARAAGRKGRVVEYGYRLEFDRDLELVSLNKARVWRCEPWGNPGSLALIRSPAGRSGTVLELVCRPGGKDKTAFSNLVPRNLAKKRAVLFDVYNPAGREVRIALALVTGAGQEWYESKQEAIPAEKWVRMRFDLTRKAWKSKGTGWRHTAAPADLSDVRNMVILIYNRRLASTVCVGAVRFEVADAP